MGPGLGTGGRVTGTVGKKVGGAVDGTVSVVTEPDPGDVTGGGGLVVVMGPTTVVEATEPDPPPEPTGMGVGTGPKPEVPAAWTNIDNTPLSWVSPRFSICWATDWGTENWVCRPLNVKESPWFSPVGIVAVVLTSLSAMSPTGVRGQ